jgi:hypothetical protein
MLRTTTIGFVSAVALGVSLASPAGAMGGHMGSAGAMGGHMGGGAIHGPSAGHGSIGAMRSDSSPGRFAQHDMGRTRMGGDHEHERDGDHDRDHHGHFRFFGVNTYADVYDPTYGDCWELHRVWTHAGWRLHRSWVCN